MLKLSNLRGFRSGRITFSEKLWRHLNGINSACELYVIFIISLRFGLHFYYPNKRTTVWIQSDYLNNESFGVYFGTIDRRFEWFWDGHEPRVFTHFVIIVSFANEYWTLTIFGHSSRGFQALSFPQRIRIDWICIIQNTIFVEEKIVCTHSNPWWIGSLKNHRYAQSVNYIIWWSPVLLT